MINDKWILENAKWPCRLPVGNECLTSLSFCIFHSPLLNNHYSLAFELLACNSSKIAELWEFE